MWFKKEVLGLNWQKRSCPSTSGVSIKLYKYIFLPNLYVPLKHLRLIFQQMNSLEQSIMMKAWNYRCAHSPEPHSASEAQC